MHYLARFNGETKCQAMASCSLALHNLRHHVLTPYLVLPKLHWMQQGSAVVIKSAEKHDLRTGRGEERIPIALAVVEERFTRH